MHAGMCSQHTAVGVHHIPTAHADPCTQERLGITGRNEADVMTVRLVRHQQAALFRLGPDIGFGTVAHREHRAAQLFWCQHPQHVRLVLVRVHRAAQPAILQTRVMARGHRVEAQRDGPICQRRELDLLVAFHARIRGAALGVRLNEIVDDILFESISEIPYIERDSEHIGDAPRIGGVLLGAASARSRAQCARRGRQRQVHTDHLVSGVDHAGGSHRGVDSPAHGGKNFHDRPPALARAAARARGTAA
ncbi:Uncharacterised protein [Mycobacteroides abscessus subsp. massiliense]|nr:Uncharacterised protein [Mycobacteroides abscessus subsp. massiliense]